ncbi:MAG: hypothetical protein ACRDQA_08700 [Nocardioidaceae bacterium]
MPSAEHVRVREVVDLLDEARALTLTYPSASSPTFGEEYAAWRYREVLYFARKADLLARIAAEHENADAHDTARRARAQYEQEVDRLVADTLADLNGGGR